VGNKNYDKTKILNINQIYNIKQMKTIGLIGGISWESTAVYYRIINQEVNKRLGGKHSAKVRMYSFDFDEIFTFNQKNDTTGIGNRLVEEAVKLERSGAGLLLLCANTAHQWADQVQSNISIPLIHIAESTGKAIQRSDSKHVLLLGTKYTMEGDFIKGKLNSEFNILVTVPEIEDIQKINHIIYEELVVGDFKDSSKQIILHIINKFNDIEGVILGCTELPLIIGHEDTDLPLFNTTILHARAAVDFALK
jgi:aspartate racemase